MSAKGENSMLSIIFAMCMLIVFGRLLIFGIRAAWGIAKVLCTIVLLPVILIALVFGGLIYIAFLILIVVGVVSIFTTR